MKSTTIVPLVSLVMAAASAKDELSSSRLRRRQLQEALLADFAAPDDKINRALQEAEDISDLVVATPCLQYSFEGTVELPDDDPCSPTYSPASKVPSTSPTDGPTNAPSKAPTKEPTPLPTEVEQTSEPTSGPTNAPSNAPTNEPTPLQTTAFVEVEQTPEPTSGPTSAPSNAPTKEPTPLPTTLLLLEQTPEPTSGPTNAPSKAPTEEPTLLVVVEREQTPEPTSQPTTSPTLKTKQVGEIPIPVPEPCCDYCSCDGDITEYTEIESSSQSWGVGSKSSKSSKGSKSSKSSSIRYGDYGVDASTLRVSEMLAYKDAQNSAHYSRHLSTFFAAAAVAIYALR